MIKRFIILAIFLIFITQLASGSEWVNITTGSGATSDMPVVQTIQVNSSFYLNYIELALYALPATNHANTTIDIYNYDSSTLLASSPVKYISNTVEQYIPFNFTPILLIPSVNYSIKINDNDGNGDLAIGTSNSNNPYWGGIWVGHSDTDIHFKMHLIDDTPILMYPVGINIFKTYPPLTSSVNFTWTSLPNGNKSHIQVSKDSNFNLLAVDTTTVNNYSQKELEAGSYWWKVQYYNSTTGIYGNWSDVGNFTLTNTQTTTGTAIQGTVYEIINGINTPVTGALVTLANNLTTQTHTMLTGSNGYYLFTGLTNLSTYYVKASRSDLYKDSAIEYVTTGAGTWTTKDILLQRCTSDYDCGNNQHYVSFYVQNVYYAPYPDVTVSIVNDGEAVPIYTGTTGTDGIYQVRLMKNQKYVITFTHGSDTVTWSNYFPSDAYTVTLGTLPLDFNYNITGSTAQFLVKWSNLEGTADMTIRNTTGRVLIQTNTSTSTGGQFVFTPLNLTDIYYLSFNASTTSGDVNSSRIYDFRGSSAHPIGRNWSYGTFTVSQTYKNYISYIFIICLAGTFGALYAPLGGVILILTTLFFVWYGWLAVIGISTSFVGGIAVIVIIRYLQTKDGE